MTLPIVIIGTAPRCGSTPYAHLLEQKMGIPSFHEPWNKRLIESSSDYNEKLFIENPFMQKQNFIEYMKLRSSSNRYIVKIFFADIEHRCPYHPELKIGYKIGLFRRNVVDQIASYYIAEGRKKFHDNINDSPKNYTISIDPQSISAIIYRVTNANYSLENCQILDKKIYYEDIDFSELKSIYRKTLQPLNLEDLKNKIKEIMNEPIPNHWKFGLGSYVDKNKMSIKYVE